VRHYRSSDLSPEFEATRRLRSRDAFKIEGKSEPVRPIQVEIDAPGQCFSGETTKGGPPAQVEFVVEGLSDYLPLMGDKCLKK